MSNIKWGFFKNGLREQQNLLRQIKALKKVRINEKIRLVPFDGTRKVAIKWYQDVDNMFYIVGTPSIYTKRQIQQMYHWQNKHGQLYYIEYHTEKGFQTIGDVWLSEDDYAIVIDKKYRKKGIGRSVTKYFIHKAKKMNREFLVVSEVFNWNTASQKMFTSLNFYPYRKQKDAWSYRKRLRKNNLIDVRKKKPFFLDG